MLKDIRLHHGVSHLQVAGAMDVEPA